MQRVVVEAAHRAGLPLSSHYLYPAANLGMDGMEHTGATNRLGYSHTVSRLGRSYQDAIALLTRPGMSLTPTLFTSSALYADDRSLVDDERSRVLFPPWEYERYLQKALEARQPPAVATRALLKANVDMALRVHRGGGLVITGTDAPLDNVAVSLHQNLRAMVAFGFTPYEALVTATGNPARWLGRQGQLGSIQSGAMADLSFLAGNPLADIRAAASVRTVMVGGRLHTVEELLTPFRSDGTGRLGNTVLPPMRSAGKRPDHWWHEPEWTRNVCCGR